jgi:hypothetical protein
MTHSKVYMPVPTPFISRPKGKFIPPYLHRKDPNTTEVAAPRTSERRQALSASLTMRVSTYPDRGYPSPFHRRNALRASFAESTPSPTPIRPHSSIITAIVNHRTCPVLISRLLVRAHRINDGILRGVRASRSPYQGPSDRVRLCCSLRTLNPSTVWAVQSPLRYKPSTPPPLPPAG